MEQAPGRCRTELGLLPNEGRRPGQVCSSMLCLPLYTHGSVHPNFKVQHSMLTSLDRLRLKIDDFSGMPIKYKSNIFNVKVSVPTKMKDIHLPNGITVTLGAIFKAFCNNVFLQTHSKYLVTFRACLKMALFK